MSVKNVNQSQFDALINDNQVVFIDFWAEWCAPCKQFSKVYEEVAGHYSSICFAKVNIEEQQTLAEQFEIRSIPHLMVFKEGIVVYSNAGSMPASALKELAEQALTVDVTGIRDQLEQ